VILHLYFSFKVSDFFGFLWSSSSTLVGETFEKDCPLKFAKESPEVKIEIRKNGKRWKSSGSAKPLQEQGQGYRGKIDQNFLFL
jgi:hypothetical protein